MRFDLFEFVEGVIRGVVYFLYNLVATLWQIFRHPLRGPFRLSRAYSKKKQQQLGGLTIIFLYFFVFFGLKDDPLLSSEIPKFRDIFSAISEPPSFDSKAAWIPIIGALVATVTIDVMLRGLSYVINLGHSGRRRLQVTAVEYALMWPLLTIFLIFRLPPDIGGPLMIASFLPAIAILLPWNPRGDLVFEVVRNIVPWATCGAVMFVMLVFAVGLGNAAMIEVLTADGVDRRQLKPVALHCNFGPGRASVDIALHNPSSRAVMLRPYAELQVGKLKADGEIELHRLKPPEPDPVPVLIGPGETRMLRLAILSSTGIRADSRSRCFVQPKTGSKLNFDWMGWGHELETMVSRAANTTN